VSVQMPRTFWMVYGAGQRAPTVRHKTPESAIAEARRLARVAPDVEFFVLQAIAHVVKRDVEITPMAGDPDFPDPRHGHPDDTPF
jgi:hypothetical protein